MAVGVAVCLRAAFVGFCRMLVSGGSVGLCRLVVACGLMVRGAGGCALVSGLDMLLVCSALSCHWYSFLF